LYKVILKTVNFTPTSSNCILTYKQPVTHLFYTTMINTGKQIVDHVTKKKQVPEISLSSTWS